MSLIPLQVGQTPGQEFVFLSDTDLWPACLLLLPDTSFIIYLWKYMTYLKKKHLQRWEDQRLVFNSEESEIGWHQK